MKETDDGSRTDHTFASFSEADGERLNSKKISVLYVDENSSLLDIVCRYLEMDGEIMVDTSLSWETAIERMRYIKYDVIVTDYNINNGDGNELLKSVRNLGIMIPVVFFVLFRSDELEKEALQYGNVLFTEKLAMSLGSPFPNLYNTIKKAVSQNQDNTRPEPVCHIETGGD